MVNSWHDPCIKLCAFILGTKKPAQGGSSLGLVILYSDIDTMTTGAHIIIPATKPLLVMMQRVSSTRLFVIEIAKSVMMFTVLSCFLKC